MALMTAAPALARVPAAEAAKAPAAVQVRAAAVKQVTNSGGKSTGDFPPFYRTQKVG